MPDSIITQAQVLSRARRASTGLESFPGAVPDNLAAAYAIQAEAARQWSAPIAGWKIGRITGDTEQRSGKNRFIGPIFSSSLTWVASGEVATFPIIRGGSAAFEAEIIAVLGEAVPPDRTNWTSHEVGKVLSALHLGIEIAGCPVPDINGLGPLATIAAFGNNLGLIVGPAIPGWRELDVDLIDCSAMINDREVGRAKTGKMPGGPMAAAAFALNQAAELGILLPKGDVLSTGAITGMHPIEIGWRCEADFGPLGVLRCSTVEAPPDWSAKCS